MINVALNRLIEGEKLSFIELREVFDEIFSGLADEIKTTSFITLLETSDIFDDTLCAAYNSLADIGGFSLCFDKKNAIQNISLSDNSKYLDCFLANDIICSANNLNISRHCFLSDCDHSFQNLKNLGVNIEKKVDLNDVEFEKLNFNYIYFSNEHPFYKYAYKISRALCFNSVLSVVEKLLNPLKIENLYLGVNDKDLVEKYANIALKLNKSNSIILSGANSTPFVSLDGETYVAEAWKNKIFTYVVTPELLGFDNSSNNEIKVENSIENADILSDIFSGKIKNSKYDFIVMNAALALYISKKAESIIQGIELAKNTINSGLALEKLEQIKKFYE